MKQIEDRSNKDVIRVSLYFNLKERLKILFNKNVTITIDYDNDSDNGIIYKYSNLKVNKK